MATGDIEDADHTKPADTWGPAPESKKSSGHCKYRNEFGICLDCEDGYVLSTDKKNCDQAQLLLKNIRSNVLPPQPHPVPPFTQWSNQGNMCKNRYTLSDVCLHNQILNFGSTVECKTCPADSLAEKQDNSCIVFGKGIRPNVLIRLKNGSK